MYRKFVPTHVAVGNGRCDILTLVIYTLTGQAMYVNVTLRHVRANTVAVGKNSVLHILSVSM